MSDTTLDLTFLGDGEMEGPDNNFELVDVDVAMFEKEVFTFDGVAIGAEVEAGAAT